MSFAEIILRIGASIGGWLIFLGLCLTLVVIPEADCDPNSDTLWRGTLFFALLGLVGLVFVGRGLQWSAGIRWIALPAAGLALYAGIQIWPGLIGTTVGGQPLCLISRSPVDSLDGLAASPLERVWPVVQYVVLVVGIVQAARYWIAGRGQASRTSQ